MPVTARKLLIRNIDGSRKTAPSYRYNHAYGRSVLKGCCSITSNSLQTFPLENTPGFFADANNNVTVCNGITCSTTKDNITTIRNEFIAENGGSITTTNSSICIVNNTNIPLYYKNNFDVSWSGPISPNHALIYGNPSPGSITIVFSSTNI